MHTLKHVFWIVLLAAMSANAAQLYRWVDGKGNVEWRDTPPPATAKKVEQRKIGDNVIGASEAPFSLQLAMKNHPVSFWATPDCGNACNLARAHLNKRGTPFTEQNPQTDIEAFKKLSGGLELPFLQVGAQRLKGYLESDYDNTLDSAGYPRSAVALKPKPTPLAANPADTPAPAATSPADAAKK